MRLPYLCMSYKESKSRFIAISGMAFQVPQKFYRIRHSYTNVTIQNLECIWNVFKELSYNVAYRKLLFNQYKIKNQ